MIEVIILILIYIALLGFVFITNKIAYKGGTFYTEGDCVVWLGALYKVKKAEGSL